MRHIFGIAAAAALLFAASPAADAAMVVGFNGGSSTVTPLNGFGSLTTTDVVITNGMASSSSASWTTLTAFGQVGTSFDASFAMPVSESLQFFDFFAMSDPSSLAEWEVTVTAGGNSVTDSGAFSSSSKVANQVDVSSVGAVSSGTIQFSMTGGTLVDGSGFLPQSGFQGFASVTAVPEPSSVAGLALLTGIGLIIHRRRRIAEVG